MPHDQDGEWLYPETIVDAGDFYTDAFAEQIAEELGDLSMQMRLYLSMILTERDLHLFLPRIAFKEHLTRLYAPSPTLQPRFESLHTFPDGYMSGPFVALDDENGPSALIQFKYKADEKNKCVILNVIQGIKGARPRLETDVMRHVVRAATPMIHAGWQMLIRRPPIHVIEEPLHSPYRKIIKCWCEKIPLSKDDSYESQLYPLALEKERVKTIVEAAV